MFEISHGKYIGFLCSNFARLFFAKCFNIDKYWCQMLLCVPAYVHRANPFAHKFLPVNLQFFYLVHSPNRTILN